MPAAPNEVAWGSFTSMVSVLGIYRNANFGAHLPEDQRINYCTTAAPPTFPDPFVLTTNLPVTPDTEELVEHGVVGDNLVTVIPDKPQSIGSVVGVYLASDTTLTAGYTANAAVNPDGTITLPPPSALPTGTTDVFVKYTPAKATTTGVADNTGDNVILTPEDAAKIAYVVSVTLPPGTDNLFDRASWGGPGSPVLPLLGGGALAPGTTLSIEYVPWPPVYLKYFASEPDTAGSGTPKTHGIFTAGEPLTFKILYSDANGDPPTYHDGVQGYVKVVFNDSGRTAQLLPASSATNYVAGVPFSVTLTDVPEGTHAYHFEASDGYITVPSRYLG